MSMIDHIAPGKNIPNDLNVIVEIPANAGPIKYEMDKETGLLTVDRFMPTSMFYPCNYGFIPQTLAEDGDPADVLLMTPFEVQAGCLIRSRPIGLLKMKDESGEDSKILAVPIEKICMQYSNIHSLKDIAKIVLDSIVHFFEHYKQLEPNKWVKVVGWEDQEAAIREIKESIERYKMTATVAR